MKGRSAQGDPTSGVADGARTRDFQDHNLVLYQLNYSHHCRALTGIAATSILTGRVLSGRIVWRGQPEPGRGRGNVAGRGSRRWHESGLPVVL